SGGIPTNSNSKTPSTDSNLGPRCEGAGRTKDLHTLGPRVETRNETRNPPCGGGGEGWEEFCDFEPCLKTNFGTSVNDVPNLSTLMGGKKDRSWDKWHSLAQGWRTFMYQRAIFSKKMFNEVIDVPSNSTVNAS
ncbi:hypothetical protein AVEN_19078-1, partial [Araneus ventricosus]